MNRVAIVVTVYSGIYGIEGKGDRPCGFAEVRRIVNRSNGASRVTRARLVDTGSAARFTAEQVARGWAMSHHRTRGELVQVETRVVDLGHIGTFADSDAGRDEYLAKMRTFVRTPPSQAHYDVLSSANPKDAIAA
jgi:hypothetical protein